MNIRYSGLSYKPFSTLESKETTDLLKEFTDDVNDHIKQGWRLEGRFSVIPTHADAQGTYSHHTLVQPMIKNVEVRDAEWHQLGQKRDYCL